MVVSGVFRGIHHGDFAAGTNTGSRPELLSGPAGAASRDSWRLRPKILIAPAAASHLGSNSVLRCRCTFTRHAQ